MTYHEASKTSQTEARATSDWTPTLARIEELEAEVERLGGVVRAAWERENRLRADLAISDTEHAVLNAQIDGLVADVERLRAENAEHLLRADSLRAELARCQAECEYLEGELEMERG